MPSSIVNIQTKHKENLIMEAAGRFADKVGVTILDEEKVFAIKESIDDGDDIWFEKDGFNEMDLEDFVLLAYCYADKTRKYPSSKILIRIDCPHCHNTVMTPKQMEMNRIEADFCQFIICNQCGDVIKLDDIFTFQSGD